MKITKVPKRLAEPISEVRQLLKQITDASNDELPDIIENISEWCWPRGDLHYWISTLNRFDGMLEEICSDYELHKLQINEFTPLCKRMINAILKFSRLLIENCTSRKLYNSYEHLNKLLFTRDTDVLESTLRLMLRFAQQNSIQHPRGELLPAQEKLTSLAITWSPRDHGLDMMEMAKTDATIPAELLSVKFQFYRRREVVDHPTASTSLSQPTEEDQDEGPDGFVSTPIRPRPRDRDRVASYNIGTTDSTTAAPESAATAGQSHQSPEGMTMIELGRPSELRTNAMEVLADVVEKHGVPAEDHFELYLKIRLAMALPDLAQRRQLIVCRLLAIACYAHIVPESTAATQLFLFEPEIVLKLASLVNPQNGMLNAIVSGSLYALDAIGRYRNRLTDVLNALNASVNHGILLGILRNISEDLSTGAPTKCDEYVDAYFGLVSFITSTNIGSGMVVGAGLLHLLIKLVDAAKPESYMIQRSTTRAIGLLDSIIYAYMPAFQLFCQAHGLDIFVRRVEEEINFDVEAASAKMDEGEDPGPDRLFGKLTYGRAHLLRGFLQSISHMMVSTGTADGLRNLIDTSLLASIKKIMENRRIIGPQNLALAISIMATFVHNEPTSLGIIQEKKLPETFLNLVKDDIEAEFDVMNAIPNAIGALCLNQAGLDMFNSQTMIDKLLSLLTSERHLKILQDQDNISIYGSSIDELVRHQPSMKPKVQDGIFQVLSAIQAVGSAYEMPETEKVSMYRLSRVESAKDDAEGRGTLSSTSSHKERMTTSATQQSMVLADVITDEADIFHRKDDSSREPNIVASYMDVTARFLEALFQSSNHCKDFLRADGLEKLLQFYNLPCLSFNFSSTTTADSMVHLLRFISEINPNTVITALLREVKTSLEETKPIWSQTDQVSAMYQLIKPSSEEELASSNKKFRQLIKLNARMQLLSDVAPTFTYSGSKTPTTLLQVLNTTPSIMAGNRDVATINDLGDFQRAWIWESVLFKAATHSISQAVKSQDKGKDEVATSTPSTAPLPHEPKKDEEEGKDARANESHDPSDPLVKNTLALRYIASQVKIALGSFFVETNRLLSTRRAHDSSHKRFATLTASQLGQILCKNMVWKEHDDTALSCDFLMIMMTQVAKLLYEDRSSSQAIHAQTIVLVPFVKSGGLNEILKDYERFSNELESQYNAEGAISKDPTTSHDALHACGGLQLALDLLLKMVSHGPLLESPSTQILKSKEGVDKSSVEYFEPRAFLVNLRLTIVPIIRETWVKKWLTSVNLSVARSVLRIILKLAEGQGETALATATSSSSSSTMFPALGEAGGSSTNPLTGLARAMGAPLGDFNGTRPRISAVNPIVDEARIRQLTDMGFPRRAARQALQRCLNNLSAATEYLLMHPEVVSAMQGGDDPLGDNVPVLESAPVDNSVTTTSEQQSASEPATDAIESMATSTASNEITEGQATGSMIAGTSPQDDPLNSDTPMAETTPSLDDKTAKEEKQDEIPGSSIPDTFEMESQSLQEQRKEILQTLLSRSLELSDTFESLVFEVRSVVRVVTNSYSDLEKLKDLFQAIEDAASESRGEKMHFVAVRLHLLALIFNDQTNTLQCASDRAKQLMQSLVTLMEVPVSQGKEADQVPTWMASLLLVLSALLRAEDSVPETKMIDKDDKSEHELPRMSTTSIFAEELPVLLDYSLQRLKQASLLQRDDLLALYRFFVILTRRSDQAATFLEKDGLALLMQPFSTMKKLHNVASCRSYAVLIMRHLIESNVEVLQSTMTQEVRSFFSQSRVKVMDTSSASKSLASVILREPDLFLDVMKSNVELVDYKPAQNQGILKLPDAVRAEPLSSSMSAAPTAQEEEEGNSEPRRSFIPPLEIGADDSMDFMPPSPTKPGAASEEQMLDTSSKEKGSTSGNETASSASLDAVLQFLLSELLKTFRDRTGKLDMANKEDGDQTKLEGQEEGLDAKFFYICFLLQSLTELLSSYKTCKTSFLNFTKKRLLSAVAAQSVSASSKKEATKAKQNGSILNFFLSELIPIGFVQSRGQGEMRKLMTISNWAMSTLVALCSDVVAITPDVKEVGNEIIFARKSVLDGIAKAIKEATTASSAGRANESIEARYGRLYSLSDLCYRLLKARPNITSAGSNSTRSMNDMTLHMAKTMLERNFVTVLTCAIAEVDLNLPMVKSLLDRILKPLEYLTKIAIKMNKAERKNDKRSKFQEAEDFNMNDLESINDDEMVEQEDGMEEEDDEEDEGEEGQEEEEAREETPDFYRNSSLGMHTGDLDNQVNYDEDDDDDDEDDDEDEDMDEGMEGVVYSDGDTDDSDEDDDDDIDEEHIVEIIEEDDDDSDSDSDEDLDTDDEHDPQAPHDEDEAHSWIDEEEDDEEEDHDIDGELDFILDGDPDEAQRLFQHAGGMLLGGGEGMGDDEEIEGEEGEGELVDTAQIPYIGEEGEDEDEDEEEMDEEEEESVLEGIFEHGDLTTMQGQLFHDHAPMDRFGATWNWTTNGVNATTNRGAGASLQAYQGNETISPFAFLSQRPAPHRHSRSRRMGWNPFDAIPGGYIGTRSIGGMLPDSRGGNEDVASHPLLTQSPSQNDLLRTSPSRRRLTDVATTRRNGQPMPPYEDIAQSLEGLMDGGAMQILETLLQRNGVGQGNGPGEAIQISLTAGGALPRGMGAIGGLPGVTRSREIRTLPSHSERGEGGAGQGAAQGGGGTATSATSSPTPIDFVAAVQEFNPLPTLARWGEGMRIIAGAQADDRIRMMRAHIVNALRPSYLIKQEESRKKKEQLEEERRKEKEAKEASASKEAAVEDPSRNQVDQMSQDVTDARNRLADMTRGINETIEAELASHQLGGDQSEANVAETNTESLIDSTDDDVEMTEPLVDAAATSSSDDPANLELNSLQQGLDELDSTQRRAIAAAEPSEGTTTTTTTTGAGESASAITLSPAVDAVAPPRERVTTTINGNVIDITDSGIDPTFLEALPEDMREEVLNQHFRERRAAEAAAALAAGGSNARLTSSNIAPEFLEALPPDLRAEVIQQEAVENQRRRREERRAEGGDGSAAGEANSRGPSHLDAAGYLASLDPESRGTVLMEQDATFLSNMPSALRLEVEEMQRTSRQLNETRRRLQSHRSGLAVLPSNADSGTSRSGQGGAVAEPGEVNQDGSKKVTPPRDAIQLLDKAGIAALVRLLFFPQMNSNQNGLRDVLINLSENSKSRFELLTLLLMILAEGTSNDSHAVDKSYNNMSVRINKSSSLQTPTRSASTKRINSANANTPLQQGSLSASATPATPSVNAGNVLPTSFIAPLSRAGDEAPFLIASRSIETLLQLTSANEQAAYYFLKDDPSNIGLMKWFKKSSSNSTNVKGKEKEKTTSNAPINILLILLGKPSILANAQLVDSLIALLNTITRPLPSITLARRKAEAEREKAEVKERERLAILADSKGGKDEGNEATTTATGPPAEVMKEGGVVTPSLVELPMSAPHISEERMASVVKPLSISISSKGFQNTLAVASNLSTIEGAQDVITSALQREANMAGKTLISELDDLLESLPAPAPGKEEEDEEEREENEKKEEEEDKNVEQRFSSPALTKLASPSSSQTVILRSLRALEWVLTRPKLSSSSSSSAAAAAANATNALPGTASARAHESHQYRHAQFPQVQNGFTTMFSG
ncbi:hypothetical protein CBS101457_003625 [Exobasidium rhododendri]|nr:hypothetical protein CBS101457_003625 [Exobasidium rhododendri]